MLYFTWVRNTFLLLLILALLSKHFKKFLYNPLFLLYCCLRQTTFNKKQKLISINVVSRMLILANTVQVLLFFVINITCFIIFSLISSEIKNFTIIPLLNLFPNARKLSTLILVLASHQNPLQDALSILINLLFMQ